MAMKEIVQELTIASERFLRVRYTVRVGAPLVRLRWLGHYHLQNKDLCTLKMHASNQNYFYMVQNRCRKLRKCLKIALTMLHTIQCLINRHFSEVWPWTVFFTDTTAPHQKNGYPELAFSQYKTWEEKKCNGLSKKYRIKERSGRAGEQLRIKGLLKRKYQRY
jgi:hypothetical protein